MALVARLPKRNMYLQEDHYGSKLHLRINPSTKCCDGTYEPLVSDDEEKEPSEELPGAFEAEPSKQGGPGHAVLFGHVVPDQAGSDKFTLKGEWRHLRGPMKSGSFEMKVDGDGMANGWWSGEDGGQSIPWQWNPSDSDLDVDHGVAKTSEGDEMVIQSAPAPRLRASLSCRTDRGKTFMDEMLGAEAGSSGVMIARWGVFCAWIFFWQTLCAFLTSSLQVSGTSVSILQSAFQAVYTITYMSFLVIYSRMSVMPPLDYVGGVVLYTLGYACFLALYAVVLIMEGDEDAALIIQVLYVLGSLLFLAGSVSLVKATLPPPVPMAFRRLSYMDEVRARFSLIDQQSSLFWGSVTFLLGSILFCLDSSWGLVHADSKPELLGVVCISMGYAFFTVGRVYFIWGSTTEDCDALMRGAGWGYQWCETLVWPLKSCGLALAKCRSSVAASESMESVNLDNMLNVMGTRLSGFKVRPTPEADLEAASKYVASEA